MKIFLDSFALIEYLARSEAGFWVRDRMKEAEEIVTVDFALAEVARKYRRDGLSSETIRQRLATIETLTAILSIDAETAILAAEAWIELRDRSKARKLKSTPALANAVMLAVARRAEAKILSGDPHLRGLPETLWPEP